MNFNCIILHKEQQQTLNINYICVLLKVNQKLIINCEHFFNSLIEVRIALNAIFIEHIMSDISELCGTNRI